MQDFFTRHQRVALLFSGGKDSMACLLLCAPWWNRIDVLWVNPGNPYPETLALMDRIKAMVPSFIEVRGDQPAFIADHGHPLDVLPMHMTNFGRMVSRTTGAKACSVVQCCNANLWGPLRQAIKPYTGVIRGDKNADELKPPLKSGDVSDGVEYLLPLDDWTQEDVLAYVGEALPDNYRRGIKTSLDCMNCTAYLSHNTERINELRELAPEVHAEVIGVLKEVATEINAHWSVLGKIEP